MENPQQQQAPLPRRSRRKLWLGLLLLLCVVTLFCLVLPAVNYAHTSPRRAICVSNMKQLTLAVLNYEARHGHFPPAYVADENGKPMHSWRVLILPFLEQEALYKQYDLLEPWNGPHNSRLMKKCPKVFQCPSAHNREPSATNYVAVVGDVTAWPENKKVEFDDIEDDTSNTILLVEVADSDINWLEPRDIAFDQAIRGVNVDRQCAVSSNHGGQVCVGFADGHANFLRKDISPQDLKALLTIAGGERIDESHY